MPPSSPLPLLLRAFSVLGVGLWLAWQLMNISAGLTGFAPGLRTLVLGGIILVSLGPGLHYLYRTRADGWQPMDLPLLAFALVLVLFETLFEHPHQKPAQREVNILPWSVEAASLRDRQLAKAMEQVWRQHLWQQNQWQPRVLFDLNAAQTGAAKAVQTSVRIGNRQASLEMSVIATHDEADGVNTGVLATAQAQEAMLVDRAIETLNSRFAPGQEKAAAPAKRPLNISQSEIDCALSDSRVQETALQNLRESVFEEPDSAISHAELANCVLHIFRTSLHADAALRHEARASANRALNLQPGLPIAQRSAATVAWRFDANPLKAERLWRQVLGTFPGQAGVRLQLASLYFSAGLTPDALFEVQHARKTAPDHPRAAYLQALAALEPGSAGQNYPQAAAWLQAAVSMVPDSDEYRLALALAYQRLGQTQHTEVLFPLTRLPDQNPDSLAYRGWWLGMTGDSSGAQALRDQLFAQGDRDPGRAFRLALIAKGRGQPEAVNLALLDAIRNADPRLLWPVTRLLFSTEPAMTKRSENWQTILRQQAADTITP